MSECKGNSKGIEMLNKTCAENNKEWVFKMITQKISMGVKNR
jgi:hypothetical protein